MNSNGFVLAIFNLWQGQRGSNPRPAVLETAALPTELYPYPSLDDFGDDAGSDGAAAFADRKPQLLLFRSRRDQLNLHRHIVPRHHHLGPRGKRHNPGHIGRPEIKLRTIVGEERRVPPALLLGQNISLGSELLVRRDRTRLRQNLTALNPGPLNPAQQTPDIVPSLALVQQLAEHLNPSHRRLRRRPDPDDLNLLANLDNPTLNPPGHHRAAARNRKYILNRHQKRLILRPVRLRNVLVNRRHQLQ